MAQAASRVALRRPDLDLRVVSMATGAVEPVADDGLPLADYVMRVPRPAERD